MKSLLIQLPLCLLMLGLGNSLAGQEFSSADTYGAAAGAEASDGDLAKATLDYWDNYYQQRYFDAGRSKDSMQGTGYYPYMRLKWFYLQRRDHRGILPGSGRLQQQRNSRSALLKGDFAPAADWESLGPNTIDSYGGRMLSHAFDPTNSRILWAGSAAGGLWRSTNGGDYWEPMTDDLPSVGVSSIAINPDDRDMMLMGTGEGYGNFQYFRNGIGVLKSTDRGLSWQPTSFNFLQSQSVATFAMLWDPVNTANVYLAATNGVWVSRDEGATWQQKLSTRATALVLNKLDPAILYAAIQGDGVYKSTDNGESWTRKSAGLADGTRIGFSALAICDSQPDILYMTIVNPQTSGIEGLYVTDDGADSWSDIRDTPEFFCQPVQTGSSQCQGWYNNIVAIAPDDPNLVFAGGITFWRSDDGGGHWTQHDGWAVNFVGDHEGFTYVDQHSIGFDPEDPATIYVFNDGGVSKSTDRGLSWERKNNNLVTGQFYALASAPNEAEFVIGGFQDHGLQRAELSGGNLLWTNWQVGDGTRVIIDHSDRSVIYGDLQFGNHQKSMIAGKFRSNTFAINNGIGESGPWVSALAMHPRNAEILFTASTQKIYKTSNGGLDWRSVAPIANCFHLGFDQIDPTIVYAYVYNPSSSAHSFWRSNDEGETWRQTNNSPGWRATDLEADPTRAGILYVTRNSFFPNNPHILRSDDYGETWTDISGDFPDIGCNAIAVNPRNTQHLYLATDLGVFVSLNGGQNWTEFNDGLPNVYSLDIHYHRHDNSLRVGTYGRGAWKTPAVDPTAVVSVGASALINADSPVFELLEIAPNPTRSACTLRLRLKLKTELTLRIYNDLGQRVADVLRRELSAGVHRLEWDGRDDYGKPAASGRYYLRVLAGGMSQALPLQLQR